MEMKTLAGSRAKSAHVDEEQLIVEGRCGYTFSLITPDQLYDVCGDYMSWTCVFLFSSRIRPHSWERWLVVRVGVVVHHGRQETGCAADRQGSLGQVRTELLLQVKGLNNLWICAFTMGFACFRAHLSLYWFILVSVMEPFFLHWITVSWIYLNPHAPGLTSWFSFPKSLDPLCPYRSQICLPGLHLRPSPLQSSSLVVTWSYYNLSPVRGADSCCSQCSHWQSLQLCMFPQRGFLIGCRFPTNMWDGENLQAQAKDQNPKKVLKT